MLEFNQVAIALGFHKGDLMVVGVESFSFRLLDSKTHIYISRGYATFTFFSMLKCSSAKPPYPCIDIHERLEDFERLYKENSFLVGHGSQTFHSKMHGIV